MVVCVRQRHPVRLHGSGGQRHRAGLRLHPLGRRSLRHSSLHQRRGAIRAFPSRPALLRRFGHGLDGGVAHGAGLFGRIVQISPRAELGDGCPSIGLHHGHGFHRPIAAVGSKRGLVHGRRGGASRARAVPWDAGGAFCAGWRHGGRRDAYPVLCDPCLYHARSHICLCGAAPLACSASRDFRAAQAGRAGGSQELPPGI